MRLFLIVLSLLSLSACTKVAFNTDEKINAMSADVFAPPVAQLGDGGGVAIPGTTAVSAPGASATPRSTPTPEVSVPGSTNLPVTRHCSDGKTVDRGVNINIANSVVVTITKADTELCTLNNTVNLKVAMNAGYIPLESCSLADGNYSILISADSVSMASGRFEVKARKIAESDLTILLDSNPKEKNNLGDLPSHMSGVVCDSNASPLFVDFRKDSSDIDVLTAPEDGVMFDILGQNGGYQKSQISWFEKGRFGLLSLPNADGQVESIDQLFGDNTLGSDGKFSDNGFLALAKYDLNGDHVIDRFDTVFTKLRLWFDFNRDGKSDSRELKTLEEMHLEAIDLEYDNDFFERDKYGNEIKFKSVVRFKSGKLRSIFDVWFKL